MFADMIPNGSDIVKGLLYFKPTFDYISIFDNSYSAMSHIKHRLSEQESAHRRRESEKPQFCTLKFVFHIIPFLVA